MAAPVQEDGRQEDSLDSPSVDYIGNHQENHLAAQLGARLTESRPARGSVAGAALPARVEATELGQPAPRRSARLAGVELAPTGRGERNELSPSEYNTTAEALGGELAPAQGGVGSGPRRSTRLASQAAGPAGHPDGVRENTPAAPARQGSAGGFRTF
jgi:hypothetical protein